MDTVEILLCLAAGFAAGIVNTLAGSGSLFTLPVLLFMGHPAHIANGTNRVGILTQTAVGAFTLRKRAGINLSGDRWMIIPAVAGSFSGALIAVRMDEQVLRMTIGAVMVFLLVLTLMRFEQILREKTETGNRPSAPLIFVLLFLIGLYGGFIQAGVGILLLSLMLLLMKFSMSHANAMKNIINFWLTVPAFFVFAWNGHIHWVTGLVIAAGQTTGAYVAARYAADHRSAGKWIRWLLVVMMGVTAWELLGLRKLIF